VRRTWRSSARRSPTRPAEEDRAGCVARGLLLATLNVKDLATTRISRIRRTGAVDERRWSGANWWDFCWVRSGTSSCAPPGRPLSAALIRLGWRLCRG